MMGFRSRFFAGGLTFKRSPFSGAIISTYHKMALLGVFLAAELVLMENLILRSNT